MGKGYRMAVIDFTEDIYTELRAYLIELFDCPVIKARNNGSPLPQNCITMLIQFENDLDMTSTYFNGSTSMSQAQTSVEMIVQLDFWGDKAGAKARQTSTLWRSIYTTERLKKCQPLYANTPRNLQYVNEKKEYEHRYMLEIALQYNPFYTYNQDSGIDVPQVSIINPTSLGD